MVRLFFAAATSHVQSTVKAKWIKVQKEEGSGRTTMPHEVRIRVTWDEASAYALRHARVHVGTSHKAVEGQDGHIVL